jgi:hypothetical protein
MTSHEQLARERKAGHLADLLHAWGYKSFNVAAWGDEAWRFATDAANALRWQEDRNAPKMGIPSDLTRGEVIKLLKARENSVALKEQELART